MLNLKNMAIRHNRLNKIWSKMKIFERSMTYIDFLK